MVRGRKKGSLWEQIIRSGRLTQDLFWLVKEKLGDSLGVEDLSAASRLLHASHGTNHAQEQIELKSQVDKELAARLNTQSAKHFFIFS